MLKPVIAATAVLAIAGSSVVYAQQRFGEHNGFGHWGPRAEHRHRPSAADMAAFTDARIAALKAGLELTPDQMKNWPAFEQALRDVAQLRMQRMQARQARLQQGETPQQGATPQQGQTPTSPFDRLARRADSLAKTSAALKTARRCRRAALSEPDRCAEGAFHDALAHAAPASSPQDGLQRRQRRRRAPRRSRLRPRRSGLWTRASSVRTGRWRR